MMYPIRDIKLSMKIHSKSMFINEEARIAIHLEEGTEPRRVDIRLSLLSQINTFLNDELLPHNIP